MEKKFYDSASLERSLRSLEETYGCSSEEVYARSSRNERIEGVPNRIRHMWMSLYVEACERGGDFVGAVRRALTPA